MIVIAHLSDTHFDDEPRSLTRAQAVMDHLENLPHPLDAVLVSGDIADHGRRSEYELARKVLLTSRHPVIVLPGNHDERAAFRTGLLDEPTSINTGPINQVHRGAGFVLAAVDTSIPGRHDGLLDDDTLTWLDDVLTQTDTQTPVLIAFHHPPVELHVQFIDSIRQFGEQKLAALIERHRNVVALLCGHAHTAAATTFAGRPLIVAPGVVSTLRLPWEEQTSPDHHSHLDLPPALAFHILDDDNRLTTHYRTIPL